MTSKFDRVCLIGGGDLMVEAAAMLRARGYAVCAVLAPRHANEPLAFAPGTLAVRLGELRVPFTIVADINGAEWQAEAMSGPSTLALCFGPSWVFSDAVLARFGAGMLNVNPIPVPRYLGGAHFTWQILNGDRSGGCFIQEITSTLDRGPVLFSRRFELPPTARRPSDYFRAYFVESRLCLEAFFDAMRAGTKPTPVDYVTLDAQRLYFPRLMTVEQGYIDWSWDADDIRRFCDAFDDPYAGAASFIDGTLVHLKSVEMIDVGCDFHPFTAGLIVRALPSQLIIAAHGGALQIGIACDTAGASLRHILREGRRFVTPRERLEHANRYRPRLTGKGFA